MVLNLAIIVKVLTGRFQGYSTKKIDKELSMCRILFTIVVTFALLMLPETFMAIFEFLNVDQSNQKDFRLPLYIKILLHVSHLASILNSSINFIIYCFVGGRFRNEMMKMMANRFSKPPTDYQKIAAMFRTPLMSNSSGTSVDLETQMSVLNLNETSFCTNNK